MNKPRRLSIIVKNVSDPIFGKKSMLYSRLIENWTEITGPELSSYTYPLELKFQRLEGKHNTAILHLAVSSARAQDVLMQKDLLIQKLNQFMGFEAIKDIKLIHTKMPRKNNKKPAPAKKISQQDQDKINHSLSAIEDETLKKALGSFGAAVYSRQSAADTLKNKD